MKTLVKCFLKKYFTGLSFWAFAICAGMMSLVFAGMTYISVSSGQGTPGIEGICNIFIICFFVLGFNMTASSQIMNEGIIKTMLSRGKSRSAVILSAGFVQALCDLVIMIIVFGISRLGLFLGNMKADDKEVTGWLETGNIMRLIPAVIILGITATAIGFIVAGRFTVIIGFMFALCLILVSDKVKKEIFNGDTSIKEITESRIVKNDDPGSKRDWDVEYVKTVNPKYIGGKKLALLKFIHHLNPVSQFVTVFVHDDYKNNPQEEVMDYEIGAVLDSDREEVDRQMKQRNERDYALLPLYSACGIALIVFFSALLFSKKRI